MMVMMSFLFIKDVSVKAKLNLINFETARVIKVHQVKIWLKVIL